MSNDVEYAVRKSIRNNPITREVDRAHARALRRNVWLACLVVAMVLFTAWQHFEVVRYGYQTERLRLDRSSEETINRKLRLNLETLRAPGYVDAHARALGLTPPSIDDTLVVERAPAAPAPTGVVASIR
ncbi:MAG TPA: hypothetical protein VHD57_16050 [Vicinamibacterales bacterium]|jgi:hypothetical protein|nr:hypothetical protein [Vicinamibacterales bacterium]